MYMHFNIESSIPFATLSMLFVAPCPYLLSFQHFLAVATCSRPRMERICIASKKQNKTNQKETRSRIKGNRQCRQSKTIWYHLRPSVIPSRVKWHSKSRQANAKQGYVLHFTRNVQTRIRQVLSGLHVCWKANGAICTWWILGCSCHSVNLKLFLACLLVISYSHEIN